MLLHIVFFPYNIYNESELTVTFFFLFCNFATLGVKLQHVGSSLHSVGYLVASCEI